METVLFRGEVQLDQIAGLNNAVAGDAVDDFVVDADANITGEPVDHRRGGAGTMSGEDARPYFAELGGGYAGADFFGHGAQSLRDDEAAGTEFFELFWAIDGH